MSLYSTVLLLPGCQF